MSDFILKLWEGRVYFWLICAGIAVFSVAAMIAVNLITGRIRDEKEKERKELADRHKKKGSSDAKCKKNNVALS